MNTDALLDELKVNPLLIYQSKYQPLFDHDDGLIGLISIIPEVTARIKLTTEQKVNNQFVQKLFYVVLKHNDSTLNEWFNKNVSHEMIITLLKEPSYDNEQLKCYLPSLFKNIQFASSLEFTKMSKSLIDALNERGSIELIALVISYFKTTALKQINPSFFNHKEIDDEIKMFANPFFYVEHTLQYYNKNISHEFLTYLKEMIYQLDTKMIIQLAEIKECRNIIIEYQYDYIDIINPSKDEILYAIFLNPKRHQYTPSQFLDDHDVLITSGFQWPVGPKTTKLLMVMTLSHHCNLSYLFENPQNHPLWPYIKNMDMKATIEFIYKEKTAFFDVLINKKDNINKIDLKKILHFSKINPILYLDAIMKVNDDVAKELYNIHQTAMMLNQREKEINNMIENYLLSTDNQVLELKSIDIV